MFKIVVFFAFGIVVCHADAPETPKVYCGETPNVVYQCLGSPKVLKPDVSTKCDKSISECDRIKCIFKESGWLTGDQVDKKKVTEYFNQFAKDNPAWSLAVQHLKAACLALDLPPQGVYTDCPAYDVTHCVLTSFIRNASPSQWATSAECLSARQYAGACPVCPSDCFAPAVPYGSCNACLSLPRSP